MLACRLRVAPVPHGERIGVRVGLCLVVPAAVLGVGKGEFKWPAKNSHPDPSAITTRR